MRRTFLIGVFVAAWLAGAARVERPGESATSTRWVNTTAADEPHRPAGRGSAGHTGAGLAPLPAPDGPVPTGGDAAGSTGRRRSAGGDGRIRSCG